MEEGGGSHSVLVLQGGGLSDAPGPVVEAFHQSPLDVHWVADIS